MKIENIHILFVDDNETNVDDISSFLELQTGFHVVRVASTEHAEEEIKLQMPDVVLLNSTLAPPLYAGLDTIMELIQVHQVKIILLISPSEIDYVIDAFVLGVLNVVFKDSYKDIPMIIREVCQERTSIHADTAEIIRQEVSRLRVTALQKLLTPTEKQVIKYLSENYTKRQIAEKLNMDIRAVKFHVRKLIKKLGGRTGREAAQNAKRKGYHYIMNQDTK